MCVFFFLYYSISVLVCVTLGNLQRRLHGAINITCSFIFSLTFFPCIGSLFAVRHRGWPPLRRVRTCTGKSNRNTPSVSKLTPWRRVPTAAPAQRDSSKAEDENEWNTGLSRLTWHVYGTERASETEIRSARCMTLLAIQTSVRIANIILVPQH